MQKIRFIWVGKLKKPFWVDACAHYMAAIRRFHEASEIVVKDAPAHMKRHERIQRESDALAAKLSPSDYCICLDERGKSHSSVAFADMLGKVLEDPAKGPCFIIGGAYGLSAEFKTSCDALLALGPMTLPHELARTLLLEQVYRGLSIRRGLPYHHE
jgi:23S rRNA (pseudouridine1915-N3)-methyltransferase